MKILSLILIISSASFLSSPSWNLEKKEDGITAYSRLKQGKDYYEFRTTFNVNTDLNKLIRTITDVNNFKNWLPNTVNSKVLKRIDANSLYGYTVTSTRWPLSDRDLVFKMTEKKLDDLNYRITLVGKENYYPIQDDKVRVKDYHAVWKLKIIKSGVAIDYIASFDPDSSTPYWAIKNSMINARIEVCQALRKRLKK